MFLKLLESVCLISTVGSVRDKTDRLSESHNSSLPPSPTLINPQLLLLNLHILLFIIDILFYCYDYSYIKYYFDTRTKGFIWNDNGVEKQKVIIQIS